MNNPCVDNRPDWTEYGTIKRLKKQVGNIKFRGVGWYVEKEDTVLLLELPKGTKHDDPNGERVYAFHVWNNRDPRKMILELLGVPTIVNDGSLE